MFKKNQSFEIAEGNRSDGFLLWTLVQCKYFPATNQIALTVYKDKELTLFIYKKKVTSTVIYKYIHFLQCSDV